MWFAVKYLLDSFQDKTHWNYMFKKSCPIVMVYTIHDNGQDFLDIKYVNGKGNFQHSPSHYLRNCFTSCKRFKFSCIIHYHSSHYVRPVGRLKTINRVNNHISSFSLVFYFIEPFIQVDKVADLITISLEKAI